MRYMTTLPARHGPPSSSNKPIRLTKYRKWELMPDGAPISGARLGRVEDWMTYIATEATEIAKGAKETADYLRLERMESLKRALDTAIKIQKGEVD